MMNAMMKTSLINNLSSMICDEIIPSKFVNPKLIFEIFSDIDKSYNPPKEYVTNKINV